MPKNAEWFMLVFGVIFAANILYLLVKKNLCEKCSFIWFLVPGISILLAIKPEILDYVASWIGIDYPPALLFLVAILLLLYIVLRQAVQLSVLSTQIKELAQIIAIKEKKCD